MKKTLARALSIVLDFTAGTFMRLSDWLFDIESKVYNRWIAPPRLPSLPQGPFQLPDGRWVLNRVPGLIGYYPSREAAQFAFEAWQRRQNAET